MTDSGAMASAYADDEIREEDAFISPPSNGGLAPWHKFSRPAQRAIAISIDAPAEWTIGTSPPRHKLRDTAIGRHTSNVGPNRALRNKLELRRDHSRLHGAPLQT